MAILRQLSVPDTLLLRLLHRTKGATVAIDTSGRWWVGSAPEDLEEYLRAYSSDGYKVDAFRLAVCQCGGRDFSLSADDDEGTAQRVCSACQQSHFICDSEEYWADSHPEEWGCTECGSKLANVGVGFSLYDDDEVRWLYVGERCASCGVLGCFAGWKAGYAPSKQLLNQV